MRVLNDHDGRRHGVEVETGHNVEVRSLGIDLKDVDTVDLASTQDVTQPMALDVYPDDERRQDAAEMFVDVLAVERAELVPPGRQIGDLVGSGVVDNEKRSHAGSVADRDRVDVEAVGRKGVPQSGGDRRDWLNQQAVPALIVENEPAERVTSQAVVRSDVDEKRTWRRVRQSADDVGDRFGHRGFWRRVLIS